MITDLWYFGGVIAKLDWQDVRGVVRQVTRTPTNLRGKNHASHATPGRGPPTIEGSEGRTSLIFVYHIL